MSRKGSNHKYDKARKFNTGVLVHQSSPSIVHYRGNRCSTMMYREQPFNLNFWISRSRFSDKRMFLYMHICMCYVTSDFFPGFPRIIRDSLPQSVHRQDSWQPKSLKCQYEQNHYVQYPNKHITIFMVPNLI